MKFFLFLLATLLAFSVTAAAAAEETPAEYPPKPEDLYCTATPDEMGVADFCDGFDDFSGSERTIHADWRASENPDDNDSNNRGYWKVDFDVGFGISDNDLTADSTFVWIKNANKSVFYRDNGKIAETKNYQVTATISAGDNDNLGVAFYYQDVNNFYRLSFNNDKALYGAENEYPHSIYLTKHDQGDVELLAISPWPGTHHEGEHGDVVPFNTIMLRIKVVTRESVSAFKEKYILAQYYNPSIGDFVNLFDEVVIDQSYVNYGFAGVYAKGMGDRGGGKLHHINVKPITRINDITRYSYVPPPPRDQYLLDYRDTNGNGEVHVDLTYEQYVPALENHKCMYWFLDDKKVTSDCITAGTPVYVDIPVGKHTVFLYEELDGDDPVEPDITSLSGTKEVWVSSKSAFTIAVLPDLHVDLDSSTPRDDQIEGILKETSERETEDNIKACIQVGDMAYRGSNGQLAEMKDLFELHLPDTMPIIAAIGNHDYAAKPITLMPDERNSKFPDTHIFPVVEDSARVDVAVNNFRNKPGYGVETPAELDNMYFLFEEDYLGDPDSGKWLVLSLQPNPMTKDLFWAEKIIKTYSNYNVILVTHQFLNEYDAPDNNDADKSIDDTVITHPNWGKAFTHANSAKDVWDFLNKYEQIKIVLDGHTSLEGGLLTQTVKRDCGNDVFAVMTDVSYTHTNMGAGGQFRLLEIDPYLNKVRGRLVHARTKDNVPSYPDKYKFHQQAINTTHSDVYFVKDMEFSNTNSPDVLLFEDFNEGLPNAWDNFPGPESESTWNVDMSNEPDSPDHTGKSSSRINETDIERNMSKFGRVQESGGPYDCNYDIKYDDGKFLTGTYLAYNKQTAINNWSNYTFELDLYAGDNDGIGVMFYYTDENNYYRFSMFRQSQCGQGAGYYSLEKVYEENQEVKTEVLYSGENEYASYFDRTPYKIAVDLSQSGVIKIDVFDSPSQSSEDRFISFTKNDSTHTTGTVALYSWAMENDSWQFFNKSGAIFDNVLVTKNSVLSSVKINIPTPNSALQDGVTFEAEVSNFCGAKNLRFSIREPDGAAGIPMGYEDLQAVFNELTGKWELVFDTIQLQDGYYVLLAKVIYESGNVELSDLVPFSIRNWAVVELLPASKTFRAGRTMPIKFALKTIAAVDPSQPFVYNEELEIRIYDMKTGDLVQSSFFGDASIDYRINSESEHYITNFKTSKKQTEYLVEVWRPSNNFLIGDFIFETVKKR